MPSDASTLWIEVLSRQDEVLTRHRVRAPSPGEELRIGRGYDNDLVLDDPYVAARHLRIVRDESGALIAEDLGSANGLFAGDDRRRTPRAVLDGERAIRVGRTRLRVRGADHAVAPERVARPRRRVWPLALGVGLVLLAGESLTTWIGTTSERTLSDYLSPLAALCVALVAWTTVWAVLSRIFSGRARFERHLLIATSGLLGVLFINELTSYGAYALSQRSLVSYRYVAEWVLAGVVCFLHLRLLSQSRETSRSWLRLKAAAIAVLTFAAIGLQALSQSEARAKGDGERFLRTLKPPTFRLATPEAEKDFFAAAAQLQDGVDRARSGQPAAGWDLSDDDD